MVGWRGAGGRLWGYVHIHSLDFRHRSSEEKGGCRKPELGVSVTCSAAIIVTEVMAAFRRLVGSEASIYCSSSCTRLDHNQSVSTQKMATVYATLNHNQSVSTQKHGHPVCYTKPQPECVHTETRPPCMLH